MTNLPARFAPHRAAAMIVSLWLSCWAAAVPAEDEPFASDGTLAMQDADTLANAPPWPLQFTQNGRTFQIYQPQVDRWDDNARLEGRSAVSISDQAGGPPSFGVLHVSARTDLDRASRVVTVRDTMITKADFPGVKAGVEEYLSVLRPQLAAHSWRIAQERLQSNMEIDRITRQSAQQPLKDDPPRIIYSDRPALLVPIEGDPVLRPFSDTGLLRVTNTRALLLQEAATSRYYLFVSDRWMQSKRLEGPWSVAANLSAQLEQARQAALQQGEVDLLQPDASAGESPLAPAQIVVSTVPTELLQTDGPPQYAPIERTRLLYVVNSPNKLFLDLTTQNHYALISGRWYRAPTLAQTQWTHVPSESLPGDFAMIPPEHPTQVVRAAVPGTVAAREAVIENSIPQVATVARGTTHPEIDYDGDPVFQPIEGTLLQSAVNAPLPVIRVSENVFYALANGVWFMATSPFGPWAVASQVPAAIYSIPRSSPLHYVTFVRVYDATPEVVYVGYTPGYAGSYVSHDNVVVYGTGWHYRPWIGHVWYGAPITWGFGFSHVHSWWHPHPWHRWHRTAWAPPRPYYRPWWGPWHAPVHRHRHIGPRWGDVGRVYERWDRRSVPWHGHRMAQPQRSMGPAIRQSQGEQFGHRGERRLHDGGWRDERGSGNNAISGPSRVWRSTPERAGVPSANPTAPAAQLPARRAPDAIAGPSRVWRTAPQAREDVRRQIPEASQHRDQRAPVHAIPRARNDARNTMERSRPSIQQDRPIPRMQPVPRMSPGANGPIERATSRAQPRVHNPPAARIERPAMSQPGQVARPAIANPSRVFQHPPGNAGQRRGADR